MNPQNEDIRCKAEYRIINWIVVCGVVGVPASKHLSSWATSLSSSPNPLARDCGFLFGETGPDNLQTS